MNLMSKTNSTVAGSIDLRGEIVSWTDAASKREAAIEMMGAGVSWARIIGTDDTLFALPSTPARGF